MPEEIQKDGYSEEFSEDSFFDKIKKFGKKAGISVVYTALLLYYVMKKPDIPLKTKGIILGALGYFIVPTDAIPDLIPVAGYSDDLGALVLALAQVSMHVDDDVKNKARKKLTGWFGDYGDSELEGIDKQI